MNLSRKTKNRCLWWLLFLSALIPLGWLIRNILINNLGPDPADAVVLYTGEWTINFLWAALAVTPLRMLMRWNWLAKYRRMIGLYALFYAVLHVLAFLTFILEWNGARILEELVERPYIIVGALAFAILIPLGITSYGPLMRRMGKQWVRLHRLVYVAGILALVHIIWQVRSDYTEAAVYGAILALLFAVRIYKRSPLKSLLKKQRTDSPAVR